MTLAIVALQPGRAHAAWPIGGMRLSLTDSAATMPVVAPDGSGGVIVAWFDHRDVDVHAYATRRLADGSVPTGWEAGGVVLAGDVGNDPDIVPDGFGGAYVAWKYFGDVAIQHITAAGVVAGDWYAPNGANLPGHNALTMSRATSPAQIEHEEALHPRVLADPGVGVVGVYPNNGRFYNSTWVWKIYCPGVTAPPSNSDYGLVDPTSYDQQHPAACDDGANGVLVAYVGNPGVQIRRYAEDGSPPPGWPAGQGITIVAGDLPAALGICPDGTAGAYVLCGDPDAGRFLGLRLQRVRGDATPAPGWPAGGIMITTTINEAGLVRGDDPWGGYQLVIVADGVGGAIMTWTDLRSDAGDVYAMRIRADGTPAPGWPAGGLAVASGAGIQHLPQLTPDGAGGAYLAWVDLATDAQGDLMATHLTASGVPASGWPAGGRSVASGAGGILNPRLTADGAGGAYVVWADTRDPQAEIRLARLGVAGVAGVPEGGRLSGLGPSAVRPDPWRDEVAVEFTLDRGLAVRLELLDVTGRRIATSELGSLGPGEHTARLTPGRELPAGVYLLRVSAGGKVWSARTVHLR